MDDQHIFKKDTKFIEFLISVRVGWFLAIRDVKRANIWTTTLIIFVMSLTFLNLVVSRGILLGLVNGEREAHRQLYSGDIIITTLDNKSFIKDTSSVLAFAKSIPSVQSFTARYVTGGTIQSGYTTRKNSSDVLETITANITGIDPTAENDTTGISHYIVEGNYLQPDDFDKILVGADLVSKYTTQDSSVQPTLRDVHIGSKVHLFVNGFMREVTIKGFVKTKVQAVDQRIFIPASELRDLMGRYDQNVNEIAIRLKPKASLSQAEAYFINNNISSQAKVQTYEEATPQFVKDIETTLSIVGDMIGTIALVVASITIFIVIFVNAIMRRKYIGILKGIGISSFAIEVSYVLQAIFYALCGVSIGLIIIYGYLVPHFAAHPINFPLSNGILVASVSDVSARIVILFIATLFAGYVPAWMVTRQNTLDAILGR